MTTFGPYIAASLGTNERYEISGRKTAILALTRTTDGKVRWFEDEESPVYDAAVGPDDLDVAPAKQDYGGRTRYLYLYDLTRFDEIGTEAP
jgi:hypothetical protein